MLDEKFLAKIKKNLEKEKIKIEREIKKDSKFPSYGSSEDENAQEMEEFTEKLGVQKKFKSLLREITIALSKIAKSTYGVCDACKGEIGENRLEAVPTASLCASCASKKKK